MEGGGDGLRESRRSDSERGKLREARVGGSRKKRTLNPQPTG